MPDCIDRTWKVFINVQKKKSFQYISKASFYNIEVDSERTCWKMLVTFWADRRHVISLLNSVKGIKQTRLSRFQLRNHTQLNHCLPWTWEPRPDSSEFAVCISILATIHSDGILFQHIAISQAICLLPQGLLSIEHILWSQQKITSRSEPIGVCAPRWKFISTTVSLQYSKSDLIMDRKPPDRAHLTSAWHMVLKAGRS